MPETIQEPAVKDAPAIHQLDKLPDLPAATPWYKEPIIWIVILFGISTALIFLIAGYFRLESIVTTAFVGTSGTIHTTAAAALGGDKIARKGIYALAANKDGITQPGANS